MGRGPKQQKTLTLLILYLPSSQPAARAAPTSVTQKMPRQNYEHRLFFNSPRKCSHQRPSVSPLSHWRRLPPASIRFRSRLSWAEPSLEVTSAWPRPSVPFWPLPVSGRTPSSAAPPFPPPRADRRAPRRRFRCGPRPGCGPRLRTSPRLCCSAGVGAVACSTAGGPAAPRIGKPRGPGFLSRGGSGRCSRWRGGGVKGRQVCRDRREDAGRRSARVAEEK